jgi:putative ATP-dependent endonuclease of the OLD family
VLLRSVQIQNFRSLEDVSLAGFSEYNVLIGRNNAGKSSVFAAISYLAGHVFGRGLQTAPDVAVLTDHDSGRELGITLTLEPEVEERAEFVERVIASGVSEERREAVIHSPLLRQVACSFRSGPGNPSTLRLREVRIQAEDGKWARIHNWASQDNERTDVQTVHLTALLTQHPDEPISADRIDLSTPRHLLGVGAPDLTAETGTAFRSVVDTWVFGALIDYISTLFFFSPFRHATEMMPAEARLQLASDGSDLPVVLNYLSGARTPVFHQIEQAVQQAIPEVGILHAGLLPMVAGTGVPHVHISFEQANGDSVVLRHMGGGVEELLMTATVIATEGPSSTLFLEEPETHLHPGAQRYLAERVRSGVKQVFIATHSPAFMNVPSPRSVYRVALSEGRTVVTYAGDTEGLALALEEIDARNSDVLLSDAVLFVEGPTDRDVFQSWSRTLNLSFDETNTTILPTGGGAHAVRNAAPRSEVLIGISQRVGIPHLFVLDRDERPHEEVESLERQLGERVHLLARREIENYLLEPNAILAAIREKHRDNAPVLEQVDAADSDAVAEAIRVAAEGLFGTVLLKRIRAEIGGLPEGFLSSAEVLRLASSARADELPGLVLQSAEAIAASRISSLDIPRIVRAEQERLQREWEDPDAHLVLAPGEEILSQIFARFGSTFTKRTDAVRIARAMPQDAIDPEIGAIVTRAVGLRTGHCAGAYT